VGQKILQQAISPQPVAQFLKFLKLLNSDSTSNQTYSIYNMVLKSKKTYRLLPVQNFVKA